jgi:formimidoylglutamase
MSGNGQEAGNLPGGAEWWQARRSPREPVDRPLNDSLQHPLGGARAAADPRDPRASALLRPADALPEKGPFLVGVPYDGGIPSRPGARFGPRALREGLSGFASFDGERELPQIADLGDLQVPTMNGGEAHARIEAAARRAFDSGGTPIFIGGDHGCTGSIIRGLAAARPELRLALISIDAHLDVREYEDDSLLSSGTPFRRALECSILEGSRTAMVGLRRFANSRHYLQWAGEQGVNLVPLERVASDGARTVAAGVLSRVMPGADALYLSIDIDAADVSVAPGVSAPGIGGLSTREMIDLVAAFSAHPALVGVDLMELSPPLDPDGRTARLAARLLLEAVGAMAVR